MPTTQVRIGAAVPAADPRRRAERRGAGRPVSVSAVTAAVLLAYACVLGELFASGAGTTSAALHVPFFLMVQAPAGCRAEMGPRSCANGDPPWG